jgi:5-methyltetrahydrofolate--homocysteine methyltransferase
MGLSPEAAIGVREALPARPAAFGANCGIGPAQLVESVLGLMRAAAPGDLIVAKGNCGVPHYHEGQIHYDGTPEIMAAYACLARDAGARVIGGCCGTTAAHIRAMIEALAARPPGPAPDRAAIEAALGPLPAPPSSNVDSSRIRRRRRA